MKTRHTTHDYERSHGKRPRSTRGSWAFEIEVEVDGGHHYGQVEQCWFAPSCLTLKEARHAAVEHAKGLIPDGVNATAIHTDVLS